MCYHISCLMCIKNCGVGLFQHVCGCGMDEFGFFFIKLIMKNASDAVLSFFCVFLIFLLQMSSGMAKGLSGNFN